MQLAYLFHQYAKSLLSTDGRIADCTVRHPGVERPFSSCYISVCSRRAYDSYLPCPVFFRAASLKRANMASSTSAYNPTPPASSLASLASMSRGVLIRRLQCWYPKSLKVPRHTPATHDSMRETRCVQETPGLVSKFTFSNFSFVNGIWIMIGYLLKVLITNYWIFKTQGYSHLPNVVTINLAVLIYIHKYLLQWRRSKADTYTVIHTQTCLLTHIHTSKRVLHEHKVARISHVHTHVSSILIYWVRICPSKGSSRLDVCIYGTYSSSYVASPGLETADLQSRARSTSNRNRQPIVEIERQYMHLKRRLSISDGLLWRYIVLLTVYFYTGWHTKSGMKVNAYNSKTTMLRNMK